MELISMYNEQDTGVIYSLYSDGKDYNCANYSEYYDYSDYSDSHHTEKE